MDIQNENQLVGELGYIGMELREIKQQLILANFLNILNRNIITANDEYYEKIKEAARNLVVDSVNKGERK